MAEKNAEKKAEKKTDKKASAGKAKKPSVFSRIVKYFRDCKGEISKITWPAPKSVFKNMGIVIAVIFVIGLLIFGLDRGLFALLGLIMQTSGT
ncbi:MAG: preprotein translocase subunit SecE [Acutalibacteraceae bacterium]